MKRVISLTLFALVGAAFLRADVVSFKNGDQLHGDWLRIAGGKLTFKSDSVGEVTIPLERVRSFESDKPAVLLLKSGQTVLGRLALGSWGDWYVATQSGTRVIRPDAMRAIYPREVYEPESPERTGRPWQAWHGAGSIGYSLVRGDVQARNISLGLDGVRLQPRLPELPEHWRTNYHMTTLLANTRPFNGPRVSADSATSSLRQDFLFTPSNFFFALGQLDRIQAQSLNLRQTYGGGFGRDLIRNSRATLNLLGGTTWVKENFQYGVRRQNAEGLVGEKLNLKLSEHLVFSEYLNLYPSLSETGEYRVDMTSTFSAHVSSWLSMNTGFTDRFLSQPLPGHMGNEFLITTGLGFRF